VIDDDKPLDVAGVALQAAWLHMLFKHDLMRERPRALLRLFAYFLVNHTEVIGSAWEPILHDIMQDFLKATKGARRFTTREIAALVDLLHEQGASIADARGHIAQMTSSTQQAVTSAHVRYGRYKGQAGRPRKTAQ